jgi:hypothetical protein
MKGLNLNPIRSGHGPIPLPSWLMTAKNPHPNALGSGHGPSPQPPWVRTSTPPQPLWGLNWEGPRLLRSGHGPNPLPYLVHTSTQTQPIWVVDKEGPTPKPIWVMTKAWVARVAPMPHGAMLAQGHVVQGQPKHQVSASYCYYNIITYNKNSNIHTTSYNIFSIHSINYK